MPILDEETEVLGTEITISSTGAPAGHFNLP